MLSERPAAASGLGLLVPPPVPVVELVSELAFALLLVQLKVPWILPLPPSLADAIFLKLVQDFSMSPVLERSKAPLTSLRAGNETLHHISNEQNQGRGYHVLIKATPQLDGATDGLERRETVQLEKSRVVGNQETATNSGQARHGDILEVDIADERDVARLGPGKIGRGEIGKVVEVELGRVVDGDERGRGELGNVGNDHVGDPGEVGHVNLQPLPVGLDAELVAEVAELRGERRQAAVVVDSYRLGAREINARQGAQERVADGDLLGLGQTRGKAERVKSVERLPVERLDLGDAGEAERRERRDVLHLPSASDSGEVVRTKGLNLAIVEEDKVARDRPRARNVDARAGLGGNQDRSADGLAASKTGGIGLAVDGCCHNRAGRALSWSFC